MAEPKLEDLLKAPEYQVRIVLQQLCNNAQVKMEALQHYKVLLADQSRRTLKRKATTELHVCVKCNGAFSEEENLYGACQSHPGLMQPDDEGDFWADFWEPGDGIVDSEESRQEFPEGFRWDCCEKLGTEGGCVVGRHETRHVKRGNGVAYSTKLEPIVIEDSDEEGGRKEEAVDKDFDTDEEDCLDATEERDSGEEEDD